MKLYNGSAFKIENPKILTSGFYKDLGTDFIVPMLKNKQEGGRQQEENNI